MKNTHVTVIAEVGVNHNGSVNRALEMVEVAAKAGADYVKFQIFDADSLVANGTKSAEYQEYNTGVSNQSDLLRGLELSLDHFSEIAIECRKHSIGFLCTAFYEETLESLISFGMDRIKIASGELTNSPALERAAITGLPIYLSTGMAVLGEVEDAVSTLRASGADKITLLHCTSIYPAPPESINLRAMNTMSKTFNLPVGFSDHSFGEHMAVAAVALGAVAIEKHFTLDRSMPGPDHAASLEPDELSSMIKNIRACEAALGDGIKRPAPGERDVAALVRRSWHTSHDIAAGTVLSESDITLKRPNSGLPPSHNLVGHTLAVSLAADQAICREHIELYAQR